MNDPTTLIETLELQPHPEGGWFRETWRASGIENDRGTATAIYFLLEQGQRSHWHRVDAAEVWFWHAGSPLALRTAQSDAGPVIERALGPDIAQGQRPQLLIDAHQWQATEARQGWALVSCVVSPGFVFEGFTLAPPGWEPAR